VATLLLFLKTFRTPLLHSRSCINQAVAKRPSTLAAAHDFHHKSLKPSQSHKDIQRNTAKSKTLEINNSEEMILIQVHSRYEDKRVTKACK
jgi:hypothetical protein